MNTSPPVDDYQPPSRFVFPDYIENEPSRFDTDDLMSLELSLSYRQESYEMNRRLMLEYQQMANNDLEEIRFIEKHIREYKEKNKIKIEWNLENEDSTIQKECSICYDVCNIHNLTQTNCKHSYCIQCMTNYLILNKKTCPMCRENIHTLEVYTALAKNVLDEHV